MLFKAEYERRLGRVDSNNSDKLHTMNIIHERHGELLMVMADLGLGMWDIHDAMTLDYKVDERILRRLPSHAKLVNPSTIRELGRALSQHSDETLRHPLYRDFLWQSCAPDTLIELLKHGADPKFLKGHVTSKALPTYVKWCITKGDGLPGEGYETFRHITLYQESPVYGMAMALWLKDRGIKWSEILKIYEDTPTSLGVYRKCIPRMYDTTVKSKNLFHLIIIEALVYRGYTRNEYVDVITAIEPTKNTLRLDETIQLVDSILNTEQIRIYTSIAGKDMKEVLMELCVGDIPNVILGSVLFKKESELCI